MSRKPFRLFRPWQPGEHIGLVGLTGSGKSTLGSRLLDKRDNIVILRTKADRVKYADTKLITKADGINDPRYDRFELRPRSDLATQSREIAKGIDIVWQTGGFTLYVDELFYVDTKLRCGELVDTLLTQGRDPKEISVVCAMQRPVAVTRFALGESTHVFSFGMEGRDAKILGEATSPRMAKAVTELKKYEFVYFYVPDRRMWRGKLNMKTGTLEGQELA